LMAARAHLRTCTWVSKHGPESVKSNETVGVS
jgi:hypothetical protein